MSAFALTAIPVASASAQSPGESAFQRDRSVSVRSRARPAYDALGLRAGSFLVFPKVELSEAYEDNVFATETNEAKDWVTTFVPSVSAESQWSRHALQLRAAANVFEYAKYDTENHSAYSAAASGRLDVIRGARVTGGLNYDRLVEPRSSASSPQNAVDPVKYEQLGFDIGASREINRLRISGALNYRDYKFDDTRNALGAVIDQGFRDNNAWEGSVRVDYAVSPALALYVTALHNDWNFAPPSTVGDVDRDAKGTQFAAGADFEISNLIRGQVQAGVLDQNFKDPRVEDATGLALRGQVEYFPTQLMTITANAERTVQATGVIGAAGLVHGALGAQVDYELLRNVILTARAQRAWDNYRGFDRRDHIWSATLGANYLINRRLGVNLLYSFYDQNSSGLQGGANFAANRIQLGLVLQY